MDARWFRNSFIWLIIMVFVLAIAFQLFKSNSSQTKTVPLTGGTNSLVSRLNADVGNGTYATLTEDSDSLSLQANNGADTTKYQANFTNIVDVTTFLKNNGVPLGGASFQKYVAINYSKPSQLGNWITTIVSFLPLLIFGALLFFMMRQAQGSNNQALSFGKSRARMFAGNRPTITFADVAGVEEAKQELAEVVEFLKYPDKFAALGARIPRGVLLVGPPGTGKTLLSRAVAGEAGVPFFSISGSEFVEMFVGVGASRVRDLFDQAKRNAPCIVFVDEIDAVGRQRGAGLGGSHDEREQTLNQLLVSMDGFEATQAVIVVAATNRPDILDPALLRPGRFDRQVTLDPPDRKGREAILKIHTRNIPLGPSVDLGAVAQATPGMTGADLANLANEAALDAARKGETEVQRFDFDEALDRITLGTEGSPLMNQEERRTVAYHEGGHTLVALMLPNVDPVHRVTITPRGRSLGVTQFRPIDDRRNYRRDYLVNRMAVGMGGRSAEEVIFGEITSGAQNDIQQVTNVARTMVKQLGMSDELGPAYFGGAGDDALNGIAFNPWQPKEYSDETAERIDEAVMRLVNEAHHLALAVIKENRNTLDAIAEALLHDESLDREELTAIVNAHLLPGEPPIPVPTGPPTTIVDTPVPTS